jgi:hypothetical protein
MTTTGTTRTTGALTSSSPRAMRQLRAIETYLQHLKVQAQTAQDSVTIDNQLRGALGYLRGVEQAMNPARAGSQRADAAMARQWLEG